MPKTNAVELIADEMTEQFSTSSGWLIPIIRAMQANNIDVEQATQEVGIDPESFDDQESRLAINKITNLLEYCNQRIPAQNFTVQVVDYFHPGMFHALGYAMLSSNTLYDALQRIARYKRVVSNTCALDMDESGNDLNFTMRIFTHEDSGKPVIDPIGIEIFLVTIVQIARRMTQADFAPLCVYFEFPAPQQNQDYLGDYFGCPVVFQSGKNGLVFNLEKCREPLLTGNPLITQVHEKMLDEFMSRLDKNDLTHVIRSMIYDYLPLGAPSQADIASELGMSLRNLQRKLHDQGTSYKDILDQTRKRLALDYIKQPHMTLGEIGYLLGFSSVGNFNRAFKRWTDLSPGQYRAKIH